MASDNVSRTTFGRRRVVRAVAVAAAVGLAGCYHDGDDGGGDGGDDGGTYDAEPPERHPEG